jgi:hypothetical protein
MRTRLPVGSCILMSAVCLGSIASAHVSWQRTYGGGDDDVGYSVQQTSDGGFIVAGNAHSFVMGLDQVYLVKTNVQGDTLWTRTYGGSSYEEGYSVRQTSDGGYIITGGTRSFGTGTPDRYNLYLIKANAQGETAWTRVYGGLGEDQGYSVQQTSDGGYIIAGVMTESIASADSNLWLIKTDASGDTVWTRTIGGTDDDVGYAVQQTSDGGYVITGATMSFGAGRNDVWLV